MTEWRKQEDKKYQACQGRGPPNSTRTLCERDRMGVDQPSVPTSLLFCHFPLFLLFPDLVLLLRCEIVPPSSVASNWNVLLIENRKKWVMSLCVRHMIFLY